LIECRPQTTLQRIEAQISAVRSLANTDDMVIVDDDCQQLGDQDQPMSIRFPIVVEQLQQAATNLQASLLAIWPDLGDSGEPQP